MPFIVIAAILVFLYFMAENATNLSGTGRIVVGSALAAFGFTGGGNTYVGWLAITLGLIIALRGVAHMIVELLRMEPAVLPQNDIPLLDNE